MTMTRQHFALIAEVLKTALHRDGEFPELEELRQDFADQLTPTNPAFNRERFLRACGVEG